MNKFYFFKNWNSSIHEIPKVEPPLKRALIILMSRPLYRQNNGSLFSGVFELFDRFLYLCVWFVHVLSNGHSPEKRILRDEGFAPDQYCYRTHTSSAGISEQQQKKNLQIIYYTINNTIDSTYKFKTDN